MAPRRCLGQAHIVAISYRQFFRACRLVHAAPHDGLGKGHPSPTDCGEGHNTDVTLQNEHEFCNVRISDSSAGVLFRAAAGSTRWSNEGARAPPRTAKEDGRLPPTTENGEGNTGGPWSWIAGDGGRALGESACWQDGGISWPGQRPSSDSCCCTSLQPMAAGTAYHDDLLPECTSAGAWYAAG